MNKIHQEICLYYNIVYQIIGVWLLPSLNHQVNTGIHFMLQDKTNLR